MQTKIKLRYCVAIHCVVFVVIVVVINVCKDGQSNYLNYGPNEQLHVLSVKIDSMTKYVYLQLFLICIECARVFASEIGCPIIGFNVYNPDKKVITEFSKNELQFLANVMWFASNMTTGLFVMITISQIDVALLRILYSEAMSMITIRILLNEKQFTVCKLNDGKDDKDNDENVKLHVLNASFRE